MEALQIEKQKQDETLDKMSHSFDNLHMMAKSMKDELDTQAIILDDVENKINDTQGKMDSAIKRIFGFLKKGRPRDCLIVTALLVILGIVLFFALRE